MKTVKIVILDGHTLNPGDLEWDAFKRLGELTVYDRTLAELIVERSLPADILLTNKTPLRRETLARLPRLKYIGVLATGYDVVDGRAAAERRIPVTNVPEYGTDAVAQMVFALVLELCNHVQHHSTAVKAGEWAKRNDFCFWDYPLRELKGKVLGIIGLGRIGKRVAGIARAFGMEIVAYDTRSQDVPEVKLCPLETVLQRADIISLHCPLLPETEYIINQDTIRHLKPTALVINTSRGKLVKPADLAEALNNGRLAGAGIDVMETEPPAPDNPLLQAANCIITPHIAWAATEARKRLMQVAFNNVRQFLAGKKTNVINGI